MVFQRRYLLLAFAICAALFVASVRTKRVTPAHPELAAHAEGSFTPDGQYPGEPFDHAVGVRAWGSWSGDDDHEGTLAIGPFSAPRMLRFGVSGYPDKPGNQLFVEHLENGKRLPIATGSVGERWDIVDFELPAGWVDRPIRIVAVDRAKGIGGWLAITEPVRGGRSDGGNALIETFAAWAINGVCLGLIYFAAVRLLLVPGGDGTGGIANKFARARQPSLHPPPHPSSVRNGPAGKPPPREREAVPSHWMPLAAGAVVAACGYAAFWAYFASALLGVITSWILIALGVGAALRKPAAAPGAAPAAELRTALKLMVGVGAFHLALLHLFPTSHDFYTLTANRFMPAMPADNALSHVLAERLFAGEPPKNQADQWQSSDRPPLQCGWQLLTWPVAKALGLDRRVASGTSAVWFQLLWVAGAYGLLRTLGLTRRRATGWVAAFALCGFFVQNTIFTWPKLAAGAFACGAFALWVLERPRDQRTKGSNDQKTPVAEASGPLVPWSLGLLVPAAFAALAWLSHGGAAFSLLALAPWIGWRAARGEWRAWIPGATVFLALALPWLAYQKFYDPPGNLLLKWHLGGHNEQDPRGTWETIRDGYAALSWREIAANKLSNFHAQVFGNFEHLADASTETRDERRRQEFFHSGRALTWWPWLALVALVATRRRVFAGDGGALAQLGGWIALTVALWCLLMFGRYQATIHHGSYALILALFVFFSVLLERAGRGWLAALVVLQAISFATTWAIANDTIHGPAVGLPFVIAGAIPLVWWIVSAGRTRSTQPWTAGQPPFRGATAFQPPGVDDRVETYAGPLGRIAGSIRAWWRNPQLNAWVLLALASLLFLRKPDALHTPQLWAEDGSIFLMQNDLLGAGALVTPYMGYLHLLPRLIAWAAPRLLDPAWWPAFYNGVSFLIWIAVIARTFSPRLDLPWKPFLALAFFLVPHTGEILFNITNLQWLAALLLIQQALIARPATPVQRFGDLALLAVVGLTGPFVIAFAPLFAWRWWRDRHRDNLAALLLVAGCAAVQAWLVMQTGPRFDYQSAPFQLLPGLTVLARRILVWPVFGGSFALAAPPAVVGVLGVVVIGALLAWALRPHPRREVRAPMVAAFVLIVVAGVFRTRPDTWAADNLNYGDRYFYIPRVLLAWLLILEIDAAPRAVAVAARLFCVSAVVMHLRDYHIAAPVNYHWARHCEPIRQGVRADIPILPEGWTLEYRGRPGRGAKP